MSLRVFHIVFVTVSVLLSVYVAVWGIREYASERSGMGLSLAILFGFSAAALVVYGRKVFRKLKELP